MNLRTRITIQRRQAREDEAGQPMDAWVDVCLCWADFRVRSGLETAKADATASVVRASARIRWRTGLSADMRVVADGQPWRITALLPDVAYRRYVDLVLEALSW